MESNMIIKFEKYWLEKEANILLSVAFVLDPRFKMIRLRTTYKRIYDEFLVLGMLNHVQEVLRASFDEYATDYGITCNQEVLKNEKFISNETSNSNAPFSTNIDIMADFYMHDEEKDCIHGKTELDTYLEEKLHPSKVDEQDDFNILDFWKSNAAKVPILSMMARDILAIPVTSVASESAFSTGRRVLNKFRSSLLPSTVEALICSQDWIKTDPRETILRKNLTRTLQVST
ncbi:hypothetical protein ACH5RR_013202 [Cinchona calisaya]|uniref:Transposase n=1 Tax=Cinchona calisaya TaxID=153742 RepID=A0ABD3A2N7_9GENT